MFRLYNELGKKETTTSEKLVRALEKCDELDLEVQRLRHELSEYHFYEYDLWIYHVCCTFTFFYVLDYLEEELFKAKERVIEISISKDLLFDSVSELEKQLHECRKKLKRLQKHYDNLKLLHSKCKNQTVFLYRWICFKFTFWYFIFAYYHHSILYQKCCKNISDLLKCKFVSNLCAFCSNEM